MTVHRLGPCVPPTRAPVANPSARTGRVAVGAGIGWGCIALIVGCREPEPRSLAAVAAIDDGSILVTYFTPAVVEKDAPPKSAAQNWDAATWTVARLDRGAVAPRWERQIPPPIDGDPFAVPGPGVFAVGSVSAEGGSVQVYDLETGEQRWQAPLPPWTSVYAPNLVGTPTRLLMSDDGGITVFAWEGGEPIYRGPAPVRPMPLNLSDDRRWLEVGGDPRGVVDLTSGRVTPLPAGAVGFGCLTAGAWYGADRDDRLVRVDLASGAVAEIGTESLEPAFGKVSDAPKACGWLGGPDGALRLVFGSAQDAVALDVDRSAALPRARIAWALDYGDRHCITDAGTIGVDDDTPSTPWYGAMPRFIPVVLIYKTPVGDMAPRPEPSAGDYVTALLDLRTGTLAEGPARGHNSYRAFVHDGAVVVQIKRTAGDPTHVITLDGNTGEVRGAVVAKDLTVSAHATVGADVWAWRHFGESRGESIPLARMGLDMIAIEARSDTLELRHDVANPRQILGLQ